MIEQQGLIAARLEDLGKKKARLQDLPLLQEISELREDYREVGLDLVKLLRFVDINANAVRKILKKFDERLGYKFTDYYANICLIDFNVMQVEVLNKCCIAF